ncbi:MAG: hypothetical protein RLZZ447_1496 [Verrucomicrobiota bacterium]
MHEWSGAEATAKPAQPRLARAAPESHNRSRPADLVVRGAHSLMTPEANLARLGLVLPPAPRPVAVYRPLVVAQGLAYVSGHGPVQTDGSLIRGRVGIDLDLAQGRNAARQCGLAILATLRAELGSLARVARLVKVLGMVNSGPAFLDHPQVINGCSELFAEVFGPEDGIGARSAVGMGPLPGNIAVEVEAIFELR